MPNTPDPNRIYDQTFIDGTYTAAGCLLVAATRTHVITWYWAKSETTYACTQLLKQLAPPLCVVLDGGQGAYGAITSCWPTGLRDIWGCGRFVRHFQPHATAAMR
ncbi:hypothetical protein I4J05_04280 [Corynebacterium diphtheriae bv. mitis]|nr:hypothetical protein [Corynebacterium diphtheriae bv. mitis]